MALCDFRADQVNTSFLVPVLAIRVKQEHRLIPNTPILQPIKAGQCFMPIILLPFTLTLLVKANGWLDIYVD